MYSQILYTILEVEVVTHRDPLQVVLVGQLVC